MEKKFRASSLNTFTRLIESNKRRYTLLEVNWSSGEYCVRSFILVFHEMEYEVSLLFTRLIVTPPVITLKHPAARRSALVQSHSIIYFQTISFFLDYLLLYVVVKNSMRIVSANSKTTIFGGISLFHRPASDLNLSLPYLLLTAESNPL